MELPALTDLLVFLASQYYTIEGRDTPYGAPFILTAQPGEVIVNYLLGVSATV